jgi:hypothetical protein
MNSYQKTGTLFVNKNGIIVLPEAANKPQRKLANQFPCNSTIDGSQNFKSKF